MLLKDDGLITLRIFDMSTFSNIGEINKWNTLIWPQEFAAYSTFELTAPVNDENKRLLKDGYVIWPEGSKTACVIEIVNPVKDENGIQKYNVKGRSLEMYLTSRIIWGTYEAVDKYAEEVMYELVYQNCVNPSDTKRKIPFLHLSHGTYSGNKISYQKTGGTVYDSLNALAIENNLGFIIEFVPREKELVFKVLKPVDRSRQNTSGNTEVILSSDTQDILTSSFYSNSQDSKNLALVAGEDSGEARKKVIVGDNTLEGFERREVYIDARDLQSEVNEGESLTDEEYLEVLTQRGSEKLSTLAKVETFDSTIRIIGAHYTYGVDYFVGDKITFVDRELDAIVNAQVTAVKEEYSENYSLSITVGYEYPTLYSKIKRDIT